MSRPGEYGTGRDLSESFQNLLNGLARLLFFLGLAASLVAISFLVYYVTLNTAQGGPNFKQAQSLISTFNSVLVVGLIATLIGGGYMFWGEELLAPLMLVGAGAIVFSPLYLPSMISGGQVSPIGQASLTALQSGGTIFGVGAIFLLIGDIAVRVKARAAQGMKADQLKYGKGIKAEKDVQNVFMGKCWQLPYCRKFVRERCPIYHSRRACWRELAGCMCEEKLIQNAMSNVAIPRDAVAAAEYIPKNSKLTLEQKRERCRNCVIYNEHQKHKYKLFLPGTFFAFALVYGLFRGPLLAMTGSLISGIDKVLGKATFTSQSVVEKQITGSPIPFQEFFLVCLLIVAMTYTMRVVEYCIFKLKI